MKSKYLAVALSAVALVACNNEDVLEVNQGRGISFQVATEASTRATATTTNTIDNFKVWGFTDGKTLMNGIEVKVAESGNKCTYDGTIFWPATDVDFYSVSPAENCGGTVNITKDKQEITNFTVNTNQGDQVDLLYAVNKGEKKADHEASAVNINFRHALSQIVFKAKNTNKNLKVIVKGVKVANIKKAGDFTYPNTTTSGPVTADGTITSATQGLWASVQTPVTFEAGVTELTLDGVQDAKDLTTTEEGVYTGSLFMIPQDLTPWVPKDEGSETTNNVYFLLDCQIFSGDNRDVQVWPENATLTSAEVAIPAKSLNWEQGKKYVYTFVFGEGGGYIPGPDPDPKPTLVGIDFTVTVDEFINGFAPNDDEEVDMKTDKE